MKIECIENPPLPIWEHILKNNKDAFFFHTPHWVTILEKTRGYENCTKLFQVDDANILLPLVRKRRFGFNFYYSMPFGYGGLLSSDLSTVDPDTAENLFNSLFGLRDILLTITLPPFSKQQLRSNKGIWQIGGEFDSTHILNLEGGYNHLWENVFQRDVKRNIKVGEKEGILLYQSHDINDFKIFYLLYLQRLEEIGYTKEPPPWDFFEALCLQGPPSLSLWIAKKDEEVLAGNITAQCGGNASLLFSASPKRYRKHRANILLLNKTIKELYKSRVRYFDLGPSGSWEGVARFKESFGAQRIPLRIYNIGTGTGRLFYRITQQKAEARQQQTWVEPSPPSG